ncbi:amidohydrolase [Metarhizobium album]|uniref:Amidohydrolase n=1 Tax=Metarhizobium album TaxID=2182425 RepID=A0A2U2DGS1_9HYPH|nr:amidohydrolase [Rhizobium album]PWE52525.1 amidohydrolase [Rhizobium album]
MTSFLERAPAFFDERAAIHRAWRHHLHRNPEIAFEERDTAAFLAARLDEMGLQTRQGFAGTGVVASLHGKGSGPKIGFRADMDALPLNEQSSLPYRSTRAGATHACGHDGHMAMLLAAADYLSRQEDFAGTLHFIFQPAEEAAGGGRAIVEDGLFDHAQCDLVFGLHNWPSIEAGRIAVQPGPMMAAMDLFTITITGNGVHAALPHLGTDTIVAAGALTQALQAIVSRSIDPHQQLVLSITQIHGGHSLNALPDNVEMRGTLRYFDPDVARTAHRRMHEIIEGIARTHAVEIALDLRSQYPVTANDPDAAGIMLNAAELVPAGGVAITQFLPSMASEDFAFMLAARKGAYAWIGNGRSTALHNPEFDFNDEILPLGAQYWVALAQACQKHPA